MKNNILLGKKKWGPVLWNIYHSFSINFLKKYSDDYIIFINTFGYILPCETCKSHYNFIINDIYKFDNIDVNKKNIMKYTYNIHKLINDILNKKNISYKKSILLHKNININNSLFIIKIIYENFDYKKMSFFTFDKIFNFFIVFCKLYPNKEIRTHLKKLINSEKFNEINSPSQFSDWYKSYFLKSKYLKHLNELEEINI